MADIDIGPACTDRTSLTGGGSTLICKDNPANAAGTITKVWVWAAVTMNNVEVATFYETNGNTFSTRDTQAIGTVEAGAAREFDVSLDVEIGDYLGIYWASGAENIEHDVASPTGLWYKSEDHIPCEEVTFSWWASAVVSLYGEGEISVAKTLVQAALISIPPLIVLPTLCEILKFVGGC